MKKYESNLHLFELKKNKSDFLKSIVENSEDAYKVMKQFYHDDIDIYESFFILLLDSGNNTIGYAKISQGGIVGTTMDIRIVAKYCVDSLATSVILAHNHPSGDPSPSQADIYLTNQLKEGLALLAVDVLDHLILINDSYYSMKNRGDMQ
jgi:DNA repair protein RadC